MGGIRLDRLATVYLFAPLSAARRMGGARIPILMYHSVQETARSSRHAYYDTSTSPEVFASHIRFLSEYGYSFLGLDDALDALRSNTSAEDKNVVVTFDDGYENFYTHAFPVLQKHGATATMFLPTSYIGVNPQSFMGKQCLTWGKVRELAQAGISFGAHSVTHPRLDRLPIEQLEYEIRVSKSEIEDRTGEVVRSFAYPFAFPEADRVFRSTFRGLLAKHGYASGVSTIIGTAHRESDRFLLERLPANTWDDLNLFNAKLKGGYNWLHPLQYGLKTLRWRLSNGA